MRIGLLSDSHGFLDEAVFQYFSECDEVWHAGDFGPGILEQLEAFKPLKGVFGNIDGASVRAAVPRDLVWTCEGVKVYMTHIGGHPGAYDRHARERIAAEKPALFICGHSHITRVMRDPQFGLLHMNPGACGHTGWHQVRTMLRFTVAEAKIQDVVAIELGPRGRQLQ